MAKKIPKPKSKISFSKEETKFLKESKLARLATVSPSGQPHVVPISFEFDGVYFYFGGYYLTKSLKFKNIEKNNKGRVCS
ncbi:MAG: pyridoxamine 5'-phosphate oxidase family protein [Nitrososphaerales archaeon]